MIYLYFINKSIKEQWLELGQETLIIVIDRPVVICRMK